MPSRVKEFHSIMPIVNIPSVIQHGILSHYQANRLNHANAHELHKYANLYFHARNPMMFLRKYEAENICVLIINTKVLNLAGVVLTDRNASSDYVRFLKKEDYHKIDYDLVYAENWTDDDQREYYRKKSIKCAEILVPNKVDPSYIIGAYVVSENAKLKLSQYGFNKEITIKPDMFFA